MGLKPRLADKARAKLSSRWRDKMRASLYVQIPTHVALMTGALVLGALFPLVGCGDKSEAAAQPRAEVQILPVQQKDVPIYGEWVATLDGYVNADIRPQVTGYLMKQNYREGTLLHKGDLLFEIDPRPFEAALQQAKGQLSQAEAQLSKTTMDVERDTPLAKLSAIPQAQLDNDIQA